MSEEIKCAVSSSSELVTQWLQGRGLELAGNVAAAVLVLLVGAFAIRLLRRVLQKVLARTLGDRILLERFLLSVVVKGAWMILAVVVLEQLGVQVAPLVAGLGITGFILGFAFQESLGSLAAGVMLAFNQPFKNGDHVVIAGHEGTVRQLDMMTVVLVTEDKRVITIPNKQAWGSSIVNFSVAH